MKKVKMNNLTDMIWIEFRKALRSKVPLWTILGSLLMPLGVAFLVFVARNPELSKKLGLISVKADLVAYSATDWSTYFGLVGMIIATAGFFLFVLVTSWVFGREFADGTVKDMLAVPVSRSSILASKFITAGVWSLTIALAMTIISVLMGFLLRLPGDTTQVLLNGGIMVLITALLCIATALPFALIASVGRGYLLPLGAVVFTLLMANLIIMTGQGGFFPWSVPGIYAHDKTSLTTISYILVILTCLAGAFFTDRWWHKADQNR